MGGSSCTRDRVYRADYPVVPENKVRLPRNGKSVIIMGGGFGGMHLARELLDRGFDVTVIEKTGMLGGKLKSWRDKEFGMPPGDDPAWRGHPRDHGIHAVWGSYNNLREFMGRMGYGLWMFPEESTVYNYVCRDGKSFQLGESPSWPWPLARIQALLNTDRELKKIVGPGIQRMRMALFKMASFDFHDQEQKRYLDKLSFPEWARSAGMPEAAIYKFFGANTEMSMMDNIDNASALSVLTQSATVSGHPDDARADVFMHPPGETYVAPIESYIKERGGKIIYNTPVIRVNMEGERVKSVTAGHEEEYAGGNTFQCDVCGSLISAPGMPEQCPVCGAGRAQIGPFEPVPARDYSADFYVLAMDIPGAVQVISASGLSGEEYFDNIMELNGTGVYTVNMWYPDRGPWKKRFPRHADFFASDFKFLGITINLSYDWVIRGRRAAQPLVPEYQNRDMCVIETQIANTHRVEGMSDHTIASLVHEELKTVMPDLPQPLDCYVNRWDTYSPQRVGYEALRPEVRSPKDNLFLIGDWVKTGHLSVYMEKAYVAAKMAVNHILESAGQEEGRMRVLPGGTPSAIIEACQHMFSVYP